MRSTINSRGNGFFKAIILLVATHAVRTAAASTKAPGVLRVETCQTKACVDLATTMRRSMNESVEPCDDFYQYACGTFASSAVIPEDKSSANFISDLADAVRDKLQRSIESAITDKDIGTFQKLKKFYQLCLDEEALERNGKREFLKVLKRLGGWPMLVGRSWRESSFDWLGSMYKLRREGYSYEHFVSVGLLADLKNNSRNLIYLDQPSLALPQEFLANGTNNSLVMEYHKFARNISKLFDVDPELAAADLKEVLQFEVEIAKIALPSSRRRDTDSLYNPVTARELRAKYPKLPLARHISRLLSPKDRLRDEDVVVVSAPGYYEKLADLLALTPKRVQANYVFWRVALSSIGQLGGKLGDALEEYASLLSGRRSRSERRKLCVSQLDSSLYLATGALYVRRHFDKATKDDVLGMVENLRAAFRSMLAEVAWMDEQTKAAAVEKLNKILPLVGYPDELLSDEALEEHYRGFDVDSASYYKTVRNLNVFFASKAFDDLRKPVDRADWTGLWGAATVVNAFYSPLANTINFPSGILQGSFYNRDLPKYVNYGRLGSVIGHEMTHGFDDQGRLFDKDGNKIDWWGLRTKDEFLKRADCIIDQYSNYTVKEVNLRVDGNNTQGENIADNGGVKEAYLAYDLYLKSHPEEPRLPGLEKLTPRQSFWLANANSWCIRYRPEYVKSTLLLDVHSPNEFRVIGMMSNTDEFAKDFNCPVGSRMNPKNKCSVW